MKDIHKGKEKPDCNMIIKRKEKEVVEVKVNSLEFGEAKKIRPFIHYTRRV